MTIMAPGIVERAFQLARSGTVATAQELTRTLKQEGYERVDEHLSNGLRAQMVRLMQAAAVPGE
jgi:hypothetical protein